MTFKIVAILLSLFIFGIITQVSADVVKSVKNDATHANIMQMGENKVVSQKKTGPRKEPVKISDTRKTKLKPGISFTDDEADIGDTKRDVNFLHILKEKKKLQLKESLNHVISSSEVFRNA
jgi:hypothetical protein